MRWALVLAAAQVAALVPVRSARSEASSTTTAGASGAHDFDFLFGDWRVRHRTKRADGGWNEFDGTCTERVLMNGPANVEEHTFLKPSGTTYGVALRAYDPASRQWAIWWLDSRNPHLPMDPPVKGRFEGGVGTFYSESMLDGRLTRTRYIWSDITPTSARWQQALSTDDGRTWETNWIMEFRRIHESRARRR